MAFRHEWFVGWFWGGTTAARRASGQVWRPDQNGCLSVAA
jgi:hypothetical protein